MKFLDSYRRMDNNNIYVELGLLYVEVDMFIFEIKKVVLFVNN